MVYGCGDESEPDTNPPDVALSLTGPLPAHDVLQITADAHDDGGIAGVQFRVDGTALGAEDTQPPFASDWDTRLVPNGTHHVDAIARDPAGNTGTSPTIDVVVSNAVPLSDRIIFSTDSPGNDSPDIYAMNGDGTGLQRLTQTDDLYENDPAVAPDGLLIAFTRLMADGNFEIFVMNAGGGGEVNLTQDPALDFYPAWSPDGSRIAFTSERAGGRQIFVMNADGSNPTQITDVPDFAEAPDWSSDGTLIAFTHRTLTGTIGIAVVAPDGSSFRDVTLPGKDDRPSWSPIDNRIAFTRYDSVSLGHVYLMDADGDNLQGIVTQADTSDSNPVWSLDGKHLVFERSVDDGNDRDIWVMNTDGGGAFRLTAKPGSDISPDVGP
jgi:Tol biopolymer transport system component